MEACWYHIYPRDSFTDNVKIEQFIIKFKNDFSVENLHEHNKDIYRCKEINKDYVEGIYRVIRDLQNGSIKLLNIEIESNEIEVPIEEFTSGQYFYTNCTELEEILPSNW